MCGLLQTDQLQMLHHGFPLGNAAHPAVNFKILGGCQMWIESRSFDNRANPAVKRSVQRITKPFDAAGGRLD